MVGSPREGPHRNRGFAADLSPKEFVVHPASAVPPKPTHLSLIIGGSRVSPESPGILEVVRQPGRAIVTVGACGVIRRIELRLITPSSGVSAQ